MKSQVVFLCALVLMMLIMAGPLQAAVWNFEIFMDGLQETPPEATPGTGIGTASYDDGDGVSPNFFWDISFSGLIGTTTNAHFHGPAEIGEGPAGVRVATPITLGVTSGSLSGSDTISEALGAELLDGLWYHNIHTTFRTGGEIRGQVSLIPEPASVMMLVTGLVGMLAAGRCRTRRD
jgi:hypothetical protein